MLCLLEFHQCLAVVAPSRLRREELDEQPVDLLCLVVMDPV
jgi:hypothetical protein